MKSTTLFYLILLTLVTSLAPAAHAQTFTVLHAFTGGADGAEPNAGVTIRGNALYGTTSVPCGTVYQLTNSGSNWLLSTLAALPNNCTPLAGVVFGPDGHLYGTSWAGGTYGQGTVFKLTPPVGVCKTVACYWTVNDLHDFGSSTDGTQPFYGDLIWDQQGNMYGTTGYGGTSDDGTVYELTSSGNGYTESILYSFSGPDGAVPVAGLIFDNKGNLFDTTRGGGSNNFGAIFELSYVIGVGWTEHVLYNFQDASDGAGPVGGLIFDSAGNLYGTTTFGGSGGDGTVFELSPSGNSWVFTPLYSFSHGYECGPFSNVVFGPDGALYGTTFCDGAHRYGSVFKLANTQNGWQYTSLHDFGTGNDGAYPYGNVTFDTVGNLYGTAALSGLWDGGVVWMIKP